MKAMTDETFERISSWVDAHSGRVKYQDLKKKVTATFSSQYLSEPPGL